MIIQQANKHDIDSIVSMLRKTFRVSFQGNHTPKYIEELCARYTYLFMKKRLETFAYYVAVDPRNESIVGIIGLKDSAVRTFFVDPDHQGVGVGKRLHQVIEVAARREGVIKLEVEASGIALPIYESFGYTFVREIKKPTHTNHYMTKQLR